MLPRTKFHENRCSESRRLLGDENESLAYLLYFRVIFIKFVTVYFHNTFSSTDEMIKNPQSEIHSSLMGVNKFPSVRSKFIDRF